MQAVLTFQCQHCFVPFSHQPKRGPKPKWCSPACANRAYRRRLNPENYAPRLCVECGTVFEISRYGSEQTCSSECHRSWYYKQNKEHLDAYRSGWAKRNRVKQGAYAAVSKSKRPEHYKATKSLNENRRRVRKLCNPGSHTLEEWNQLKNSTGNKCLSCGVSEEDFPLTRDHIVAVANGGSDDISNIQPLCRPCNSRKQTSTISYFKDK